MPTVPDGADVVATSRDAEALSRPPLLVIDAVTDFLDMHDIGHGPLAWERIGDGQSNLTYRLRRDAPTSSCNEARARRCRSSTHDMVREARIQQLLRPRGVPVPGSDRSV